MTKSGSGNKANRLSYLIRHPRIRYAVMAAIAGVWLINGLYAKALMQVPRHALIVERILSVDNPVLLTRLIGLAEAGMALWFLSGIARRLNAVMQIAVVGTMNILEFLLAPDLLLWGRLNILFAALFMLVIGLYDYHCRPPADNRE